MSSRIVASTAIFALALACSDNHTVTTPATRDAGPPVMVSASATTFFVFVNGRFTPPAVRVQRSGDRSPVPGIRVSFTSSDGTVASAVTDQTGIARADMWKPDYAKQEDNLVAAADGVPDSVNFNAMVIPKTPVATYDLQSIGGMELPRTYSGGGTSWQITGGQYVLFDDGTYLFGYEVDGMQGYGGLLPYIKRDSGIEFYLTPAAAPSSQFYASIGYLFSTATLSDRVMSVKYSDTVDFEDESYLLRQ